MSKFPIIVIEGGDASGKTTLANKLVEHLGAKYVHLTYRFKDRMNVYHGAALKLALVLAETQPVVIDRWWPSERVYASAYRGGTRWPEMGRALERVALRHGVSYVFALPADRERYLAHFNKLKGERVEMYDSGMDRVYDGFAQVYREMEADARPQVLSYDLFEDGRDLDGFVQRVVESSEDERALINAGVELPTSFENLSGSTASAEYLLVGDQNDCPGTRPFATYDDLSFKMSFVNQHCQVPERAVAYVNATHLEDQEATDALIRECSRTMRVVALGERARELVEMLGVVVHRTATHPRDWADGDLPAGADLWNGAES